MRATPLNRHARVLFVAIVGLLSLHASSAQARTEQLRWTHPDPSGVDHFRVYFGPNSGSYSAVITNLKPTRDGSGIYHYDLTLPDDDTVWVAVRAVSATGRVSAPSNESYREGENGPPPPPPPPPPPGEGVGVPFRMNAGGSQITDIHGNTWVSDSSYALNGKSYSMTDTVAGTDLQAVYQTQRSGNFSVIGFEVPLDAGTYKVRLHFTETWQDGFTQGGRVFDVRIEDSVVVEDLDIFTASGGPLTAHVEEHVINVNDGVLDIDLHQQVGNPRIEGIEILSTQSTGPVAPRLIYPTPPPS